MLFLQEKGTAPILSSSPWLLTRPNFSESKSAAERGQLKGGCPLIITLGEAFRDWQNVLQFKKIPLK